MGETNLFETLNQLNFVSVFETPHARTCNRNMHKPITNHLQMFYWSSNLLRARSFLLNILSAHRDHRPLVAKIWNYATITWLWQFHSAPNPWFRTIRKAGFEAWSSCKSADSNVSKLLILFLMYNVASNEWLLFLMEKVSIYPIVLWQHTRLVIVFNNEIFSTVQ